jgi:hypothetical protein
LYKLPLKREVDADAYREEEYSKASNLDLVRIVATAKAVLMDAYQFVAYNCF